MQPAPGSFPGVGIGEDTLMVISRIFGLMPADMAIDLGTATTRVCVRGKGLITEEPTVLAVKKGT